MSRAGLTAVIQSSGSLMHMYYQKHDGSVSVLYRNTPIGSEGAWNGGDATTIIPAEKAAFNTPLTALHWTERVQERRLFYLDTNNVLSERGVYKGGAWKDGDLQKLKLECASDTKIAATQAIANGQLLISVIYQGPDGRLHEVQYRNGWQRPEMLPVTAALFVNTAKTRTMNRLQR